MVQADGMPDRPIKELGNRTPLEAANTPHLDKLIKLSKMGIVNPFNRKQETEADYLGLIFASLSGYDIRETINIWERMKEANKGKEPPVFLSTHPSSKKRIENLNNWISEVMVKYPPIKT